MATQLLMGDTAFHVLMKVLNMKVKTNELLIKYYCIAKFLLVNIHQIRTYTVGVFHNV
jgi:hypothetical protein